MRSMITGLMLVLAVSAQAAEIRIDGPAGPLGGEAVLPEGAGQIVVIVPGSGPTDRDGNSPKGISSDAYVLLALGLEAAGIASVRTDKRGMFRSASKGVDPNAVTVAGYAADIRAWADAASSRAGTSCAWVLGHSEGGLMALAAAQDRAGPICGLILVAAPGRPLGDLLREQLKANPANAPILEGAFRAIDRLERGEHPRFAFWEFTLRRLFPTAVHDYLIDLFAQDPAALIAGLELPVLIVQGTHDIQVNEADANALKATQLAARLVLVPNMTHVLKVVGSKDRAANVATYRDPALPLHPDLVPTIVEFLRSHRR